MLASVNDSDFIKLERLSEEDIIGTTSKQGLLEQYLSLSREEGTPMQDIALGGEEVRIGNKGFVCIRCPIPMICLVQYQQKPVMKIVYR
jgi:hypothetical protein